LRIISIRSFLLLILMCATELTASGQLIVGHRGASHDAPENTISAYKLALEQGADGFEGDYWLGQGGHVVCLHDADTKRVAGKQLAVTKAAFEDLRKLDVGSWKGKKWRGEKLPTFEECLAVVPAGKKFFVELKSGPEVVGPIAKAIEKSSVSPEQIVFISFKADALAECKKQMPHIKALWLCGMKPKKNGEQPPTAEEVAATIKRIHADGLNAESALEYFNEAYIRRLKDLGVNEFSVWTIDDPAIAKQYADLGAWSITTNRPAWLRERLNSK
jgi:glycerophosphoryl diester phosphodiesterase